MRFVKRQGQNRTQARERTRASPGEFRALRCSYVSGALKCSVKRRSRARTSALKSAWRNGGGENLERGVRN